MDISDLLPFIEKLHQFFLQRDNHDSEKEMLYRHLKFTEEVGELSNDVMAFLGGQRKDKQDGFNTEQLGHEAVDVVITALLIAKAANVDLASAFEYKINKIQSRLFTKL